MKRTYQPSKLGAQASSRLPGPDGDGRWPQGHCGPPCARPQTPLGLIPQSEAWGSLLGEPDGPASAASVSGMPRPMSPERLKTRSEFVRASRGRRVHGRCLSLQVYRREAGEDPPGRARVGLTVTKKVGGAVERNRIKRRLREALRAPDLVADAAHDYVIVARRDALTVPFTGLLDDMRKCFCDAASGRSRKSSGRRGPGGSRPASAP